MHCDYEGGYEVSELLRREKWEQNRICFTMKLKKTILTRVQFPKSQSNSSDSRSGREGNSIN